MWIEAAELFVCKFVQKPLLHISRARLNIFSIFVSIVLVWCIIIMQLIYEYCCIQCRSWCKLSLMVIFLTLKAVSQKLCKAEQHSPWADCTTATELWGWEQAGGSCSRAVVAHQLSVRMHCLREWVWGCLTVVHQQQLLIFFLPWWQLRLFGNPHSRSSSLTVP